MHFSGSILIIRNQWYWEQIFMCSKSWNICIKVQFWGTLLVFPFSATLYLLFNTLICLISWLVTVQIQIIQCLYHQFKDGSTLLDDPVSRVSRWSMHTTSLLEIAHLNEKQLLWQVRMCCRMALSSGEECVCSKWKRKSKWISFVSMATKCTR